MKYNHWKRFIDASDYFAQEMFLHLDMMKELTPNDQTALIRANGLPSYLCQLNEEKHAAHDLDEAVGRGDHHVMNRVVTISQSLFEKVRSFYKKEENSSRKRVSD